MTGETLHTQPEQTAQWRVQRNKVFTEANKLREALDGRKLRREQNIVSIEKKLASENSSLSEKQQTRLRWQLFLLNSYYSRHLDSEAAIQMHIQIKHGLDYELFKYSVGI